VALAATHEQTTNALRDTGLHSQTPESHTHTLAHNRRGLKGSAIALTFLSHHCRITLYGALINPSMRPCEVSAQGGCALWCYRTRTYRYT
jgi:hypothetical protein